MTDQAPQFIDEAVRPARPSAAAAAFDPRTTERSLSFWQTLDKPMLFIIGALLAIGLIMVYSTTFDWSFALTGNAADKVVEQARNVMIGLGLAAVALVFDYRRLRRLAPLILIGTVSALIAVLLFGDDVFNARRSLIGGRFQPGELAELTMVIYMAVWLSSKSTRIRSLTYGLLPFATLIGIISGLVILQPDISTAVIIFVVCSTMFFLAGADLVQIGAAMGIAAVAGVVLVLSGNFLYAEDRIGPFIESISDITRADYHIFQAYVAFSNGGLFGVGLGLSQQKFNNALPAPHTDSIFAIIGEEFGIVGATVVVLLFAAFVWRGLTIARRANDAYGSLLASGLTLWVISKALLNIAVMLALVPPTGIALPFISFGGSSMVTVLVGTALILSVNRATLLRDHATERRGTRAATHRSGGDRRTRLPSPSSR
ncbi:MAG: FtsW/RodA/SpoVE family cell cycle protein [Anaerolineae bacterium]|nr:FtsW/RodA/SpoVE family cell cycle protein [Anaerolineae bacterium]